MSPIFERFTDRSRRVVVLAQEAARALGHNYIGTEHLLLGIIDEQEGLGAKALVAAGVTRDKVIAAIGELPDQVSPPGHIPFTPRATKALERALREALQHGHNYIGTEHLLLGLLRMAEDGHTGPTFSVLADTVGIRHQVVVLLGAKGLGPSTVSAGGGGGGGSVVPPPPTSPAAVQAMVELALRRLDEGDIETAKDLLRLIHIT